MKSYSGGALPGTIPGPAFIPCLLDLAAPDVTSRLASIASINSAISSAGALRSYKPRRKRASAAARALSPARLGSGAVGIGSFTLDVRLPSGRVGSDEVVGMVGDD